MMNGWQLLMSAAVNPDDIEAVCVRVNSEFGQVFFRDAEHWLSKMNFFTSHEDDGWVGHPTMRSEEAYDYQVWTADRIYRTREWEGVMTVISWPRHSEQWTYITSRFAPALIEIGTGIEWNWGKPS